MWMAICWNPSARRTKRISITWWASSKEEMRMRTVAILALLSVPLAAQTKKQWRTPWGDPDLQGSWSNATTTPLQRPAKYAGREFLTADERAAQDKVTAVATDRRSTAGTADDVNGAYNGFWWERGWSDGRTSLIYD